MDQIPVNAQGVPLAPVHRKPLPKPPISHLPPLPPLPQSALPLPSTQGPVFNAPLITEPFYNIPPLATQPITWQQSVAPIGTCVSAPCSGTIYNNVESNPSLSSEGQQLVQQPIYNNPLSSQEINYSAPSYQEQQQPIYNNPLSPQAINCGAPSTQGQQPIYNNLLSSQAINYSAPSTQGMRTYLFTCTSHYRDCSGDHTFSDQNGNVLYKFRYDSRTTYKWLEDSSGQRVVTAQGIKGNTLVLSIETAHGVVSGTYKRHLFRSQKTLVVDGLSIELTKDHNGAVVWTSATGQQMMTSQFRKACNLTFTANCSEAVEKAIALVHGYECHIMDVNFRST